MIRISIALTVIVSAGALAGCNSRDSLYSQGPWGPRDMARSYPRYSSPWNRQVPETVSLPSSAPGAGPVNPLRDHDGQVALSELPADPQPATDVASKEPHEQESNISPALSDPALEMLPRQGGASHASPPGVFSTPRRPSSYTGTWKVSDNKGGSCFVHLSSVAALDLYKASTSKCSHDGLRGVNMWRFEGDRVSLFSRGEEVARFEGTEASLNGVAARTGGSLTMSR